MTRLDFMRAVSSALGVTAAEVRKLLADAEARESQARIDDALRARPAIITERDRQTAARALAKAGVRPRR